ncbi:type II restriction endonuclease [Clostridium botulinum]|uniref:Type II restriction enzyme MspI n=1 Tax=Clostridium botulinum (strain Okra / Type B1) TaxID=498213 RepID=B1IFR6_CLOBK|nr:MspI family type II restriction endonuclease [Clostridium botulinum]EKX79600.1 type II restriction enzyme MspI (endonuclease MspI) [Clostridium botulinum CFSAN001628]ACA46029.1 type II restriction enzyme MspI [Clostridium botulinum B1 str. Okra]MBD5562987.1 MspI family type II restriction endonuclease [Clostridium botulinum]MBD5566488.1 MspI family type II restriction endonuclease [Clostridium botulinum]MBD5568996.1 MspI family type II restriction endonuclease [Clostridium botulinum]
MCDKIKEAYAEYNIENLSYGEIGDKLGDAYENFVVNVFNDVNYLMNFSQLNYDKLDERIFKSIFKKEGIDVNQVIKIEATSKIPKRNSGGNSKTDVLVKVHIKNGQVINIPISVKQTTVAKVAMAEYDVDTILTETGINNSEIERLMKKHQQDASAINFSKEEKQILKNELAKNNNKERLLRWILTMSPLPNNDDIRIPIYIIKFQLDKKSLDVKELGIFNIDEYIRHISTDKKGNPAKGGFGTGLSWTYATGSKGKKIQFKG